MTVATFKSLQAQIDSILERDPAARSRLEVALLYPGFHAVLFYRLAHWAWTHQLFLAARLISQIARLITGIEIHPGAEIGERLFIDHGMGVVIGETAVIGDDVMLYHGVTLGGTSLKKGKRHPTLEDGVIVGAGAKILGPITVRAGARVGSNAVVVDDVPKDATVAGVPARVVKRRGKKEFVAYGTPCDHAPDPVACAIEALHRQVAKLTDQIQDLEGRLESAEGPREAEPGLTVITGDRR